LYNPAMFIAPAAAAAALAAAASHACAPAEGRVRDITYGVAGLAGLAGVAFHLYDTGRRRPGGWRWGNLFWGAPLGAPGALGLAGLLGLAASHIARPARRFLLGMPAAKVLAFGTAGALLGTVAEVWLLHFRGAFQHRAMYLPVTLPPAAAAALAAAAATRSGAVRRLAAALLRATAALGVIGVAFHARGVARRMGGWRNWTQNLQSGPPLPAPPAFTGLAIAGLGAIDLLEPPPSKS
jgi:hypothetical protein